jgi:hypothetical protein
MDKDGLLKPQPTTEKTKYGKLTQTEAINSLLFGTLGYAAWNKLYKKRIFQSLAFPEGYLYEDVGTTYKTILLSDSIYYLDKELYYYCYYDGSITTLRTEKALNDWWEMHAQQYRDLTACGFPQAKLALWLQDTALTYCIQKKADRTDDNYVFCLRILQAVQRIPTHFTWKRKILFVLLKHYRPLFELLCILYNKKFC